METKARNKLQMTGSWQHFSRSIMLVRDNIEQVIVLALLPTLTLQLAVLLLVKQLELGLIIYVIASLWTVINMPALYYFTTKTSRGQHVSTAAAYQRGLRYFWRTFGYSLVTSLIITAGFILLIVPGLIFLRRYVLGLYYIVDQDKTISEAMQLSADQSKPAAGYIWGSLGVVVAVGLTIGLGGLVFQSLPGVYAIISSLLSLSTLFVLALRYAEVAYSGPRS